MDRGSAPAGESAEELAPLSEGQAALWFVHSLSPDNIAYQGVYIWRLSGAVDVDRLARAFTTLAERHASLRTTFRVVDGQPRQCIGSEPRFPLECVAAAGWTGEELERHQAAEAERQFDLEHGPLVRTVLYTIGPEQHSLLLSIHHIILDHWSINGLMFELETLYREGGSVAGTSLPDPGPTYVDFVDWQRRMLDGEAGERHWRYWQRQLSGDLPILELPTDRPRPVVQTFNGAAYFFELDGAAAEKLTRFAGSRGATQFMALLAVFQVLLHRYTGVEQVLVGTPMAGRVAPGFERVVGYFTNLAAMRADVSADPTFAELLEQVRGTVFDAMEHQAYPFSRLIERLGLRRDPSRSSLVDVIFAWEGAAPAPPGARSLDLELTAMKQLGAAVDMIWSLFHRPRGIGVAIQYNTDLFDPETLERMAGHFRVLLEAIAEAPDRPLSELPILTPQEERRQLVEWNENKAPYPSGATVHGLIEEQAALRPDAPAVSFASEVWSYRELDRRANALARRLVDLGVERGDLVGLSVDRSLDLMLGLLGVLKAGAGFVPIDPTYPRDRIEYMVRDSGIDVLLTQSCRAGELPAGDARIVTLDDLPEPGTDGDAPPAELGRDPHDLCYLIYTSGSTGRPKGVMVEHRGLINVASAQQRLLRLTPGQRILQFAALSFDASIFETVMALLSGGQLCMAPVDDILPGPALARLLAEQRIQLVTLPPSALDAMAKVDLPDLETIMVAGERCPAEIVRRWAPGRRFFNLYGPTEATIWSSYALATAEDEGAPPIGRPVDNTSLYVLDSRLYPVPVGVVGELMIGGDGVTRGYLDRPSLTAARYLPDPFAGGGARMYRTGDLVRYRANGDLEFIGRLDHQVKLRGFRIELGEVEAALREQAGVKEAVAAIRNDGAEPSLAGYVVTEPANASLDPIREGLRAMLPGYMVPRDLVALDRLPLSPSGKVDLAQLPAPRSAVSGGQYTAPENEIEAQLATIWQEILGVEKVGVSDNFFEIGGHSLLLAKVHDRLESELGREINVSVLFRYPSVKALALHLTGRQEASDSGRRRADARRKMRARRLRTSGRGAD